MVGNKVGSGYLTDYPGTECSMVREMEIRARSTPPHRTAAMALPSYVLALLLLGGTAVRQTYGGGEPELFFLAENGVTVLCPDAKVGDMANVEGESYTKRTREDLDNLVGADIGNEHIRLTCTSGIIDMSQLFLDEADFNQNISSWDTSQVVSMVSMFSGAIMFNQDIGKWDTSQVIGFRV